jgi:YegS/Rv2252/BmrU family lipid kinase
MGTRLALLTNPAAGSADDQALDEAQQVWRDAGVDIVEIPLDDTWVDAAVRAQPDRLVVAGGDGTVHHCLTSLAAAGRLDWCPVAVLPLGTGNDLARTLLLPENSGSSATVAIDGHVRPMDVLLDEQRTLVVNAAHVGVGALASERAHTVKSVLGPLAYPVGAVLAGATSSGWPVRVEVDGELVADGNRPLLMVGLAVGRTIGGGAPLAPQASPDDGWADVLLVGPTGTWARLDVARRLRAGTHVERDDVLSLRAREVVIDAADAPLNVDGELLGPAGRRQWAVQRHAWKAVVPAPP